MARGRPKKKVEVPVEEVPVEEAPVEEAPVEEVIVTKELSEEDKKEIANVISGSDEIPFVSLPVEGDTSVDVTHRELSSETTEELAQIKEDIRQACIKRLSEVDDGQVIIDEPIDAPNDVSPEDFAPISTRDSEIAVRMDYIKSEIDFCNAQIWADYDNGQGRIYSMYRKELATYLVRLYECYNDESIELPKELPAKVRGY